MATEHIDLKLGNLRRTLEAIQKGCEVALKHLAPGTFCEECGADMDDKVRETTRFADLKECPRCHQEFWVYKPVEQQRPTV